MPQVWLQVTEGEGWAIVPLTGTAYGMSERELSAIRGSVCDPDEPGPPAVLVRRDNGSLERWFLLARKGARVQVNGAPLVLGARLLCDRDEIVVHRNGSAAALHCYFSTERRAEIVAFPDEDVDEVRCPRCKDRIRKGQLTVRCPNPDCGVLHHEDETSGLRCWTYAATCALCSHATALDAGYKWTPEEL
jgi:hypothetical protein